MNQTWTSLYCRCDDAGAVAQSLRDSLIAAGYTLYNPFGLVPGKAYPQAVRLFAAPAAGGWVRVIGAPDPACLAPLSRLGVCLSVSLEGDRAAFGVHADGQPADAAALHPGMRPGWTVEELRRVMSGESVGTGAAVSPPPASGIPLDALPPDVRTLAERVNPAQAQKLFSRLSGQALRRIGNETDAQAEAARALLSNQGAPDWNSAAGQQIQHVMACLTVPDNWREPDFTPLRDAYQLHERRRRLPDARLYPGDAEAMARVPDALDFYVIYGGRD